MNPWVLATRTAGELVELAGALAPKGYDVVAYPVLRQTDVDDDHAWTALATLVDRLSWLAVTSPRAADALRRVAARKAFWERLVRLPVAAVGGATARACVEAGLTVALRGDGGGAALARELLARLEPGAAVVHVCGENRRPELAETLAEAGITVAPLPVYAMAVARGDELPTLPSTPPAAVLATSPRAARAYLQSVGGRPLAAPHFAIGPTTAAELESLGIPARVLSRPDPTLIAEELCQTC